MAISKDFYKAKSKSRSSLGTGAYYEAKDAQAVQDKSAVIWSQAIQNFSAQTAKAIDAKSAQESQKRKDAKDLMDRTMRYTLEEQTRVYDNLQKLGVNNPSIFQNADVLLDKRFDAYSRAAAAKTPEEQKAALDELAKTTKQLTGLETLIQQGTDASKVYSDDVNNGNLLGQGTLNLSGEKNLQWAKMMNIRNGINEGTESWGMDENGDWTITYDGPELGGPVTQKAALFFGYDPGTIPKVDDYFKELFTKVGAIDKNGELTDKYIDPNQIIQPTNDKNFSQVAYNVNKGMLAADTAQQINAYAKGLAHSLPDAEAAWDNVIPEDIKKQVANKYGVENFSDLQPGAGFGFGQLDKNSGLMFTEAMELYGNTRMQNQKLGNVVKNVQNTGGRSGSGSGSGGSSITVEDLIDLTSNRGPQEQVDMVSANLGPDTNTQVKFHPENNTVIVTEDIIDDDGNKTGTEQVIYDLNKKSNPMGVDPNTGVPGVGGIDQWRSRLVDLYTNEPGKGSAKSQKVRLEFDKILSSLGGYNTEFTPGKSTGGFLNK